jgi:hypothetical protein
MKYLVCEYCGAHLDYSEKCDCITERGRKANRIEEYKQLFNTGESGQLEIKLGGMANE